MFGKIYKWLDNYWYHYKWHTLITLFIIVFTAIAIPQMVTKTDDDVTVLYAGPGQISAIDTREVSNALQTMMSGDFNGDGKKQASVMEILIMTSEQLKKATDEANAKGEYVLFNQKTLTDNRTKFATQIFAGESIICLLDPSLYDDVNKAGGFAQLSEVLGYTPENALDGCSLYLRDAPFVKYFSVFSCFPEDTVLCIRQMSTTTVFKNSDKEERRYQTQLEMFRTMMSYELAE